MTAPFFEYGQQEIDWLMKRDKKLARVIKLCGHVNRTVMPDPFAALVHAIIGQQISGKAQATIWGRFQDRFGPPIPLSIAALSPGELQLIGISLRKAGYIHSLATEFANGNLDAGELAAMDDSALATRLVSLRGIGKWTAEMLMIFCFQRKNVLSFGDAAIQRGIRMVYGHGRINTEIFSKLHKLYTPYATIASIYLWEVAGGKLADYSDPATEKATA